MSIFVTFDLIKNNRKTTRDDTIIYVIENGRKNWGINLTTIQAITLRDQQSSLSRAGVVRVFKTSAGKEFRVSQKAKKCLVSVVEAYILIIGKKCRFGKPVTIKIKDIQILYSLQTFFILRKNITIMRNTKRFNLSRFRA